MATSQTVRASFGITVPSEVQYGGRRVDFEVTLDMKRGETPQKAMERAEKEVMVHMDSVKVRRILNKLDKIVTKHAP